MRYLGEVRQHLREDNLKMLVLIDMCQRVIKNELRYRLRRKAKKLKILVDEPFREEVVDYLNLIFAITTLPSCKYWGFMKEMLTQKFGSCCLSEVRSREKVAPDRS